MTKWKGRKDDNVIRMKLAFGIFVFLFFCPSPTSTLISPQPFYRYTKKTKKHCPSPTSALISQQPFYR